MLAISYFVCSVVILIFNNNATDPQVKCPFQKKLLNIIIITLIVFYKDLFKLRIIISLMFFYYLSVLNVYIAFILY